MSCLAVFQARESALPERGAEVGRDDLRQKPVDRHELQSRDTREIALIQ